MLAALGKELQMLELKNQIQGKVKNEMDKQQRDYMLNQQLKTIHEELGGTSQQQEIEELREIAKKKKWSKEVSEHFEKELGKLMRINPAAMDYSMHLNYLEVLVELPWNEFTKDNFNLKHAQKVLDQDMTAHQNAYLAEHLDAGDYAVVVENKQSGCVSYHQSTIEYAPVQFEVVLLI